jgi:DUF4097 and DUF4098 domain-containing protein YvlB
MSEGTPVTSTMPPGTPAGGGMRPRRRSVFGGLLWIMLGSLLLANNLGAKFGFWELLGNWWPLLLILLGLGKLVEHYAAARSGDAPARLLSGGEIFLLIILFLIAGAYSGIVQVSNRGDMDIDFPWWNSFSFTEEVSKPAKAGAKIMVNVPRGNLTIHAEDNADVRVVVSKSIRAMDEKEGADLTKDYGVVIEESGGAFEIRPKTGMTLKRRVRLDLEIHVPRQSQLDLRTERGGIIVNGLSGNMVASSRGGDVEIRDVSGNIDAEMRGGDIRVANVKGDVKVAGRGSDIEISQVTGQAAVNGEFTGTTRVKNVAKEARFNSRRTDLLVTALKGSFELGGGSLEVFDAGNVTVSTTSYDMTLENVTGRISIDNRNGNVDVRLAQPPKEDIDINNEKADVGVLLPPQSEFTIDAVSRNGRAESDFKEGVRVREDDRDARIEGKVGTRGPVIKLRSTHGTVKLRESSSSSGAAPKKVE